MLCRTISTRQRSPTRFAGVYRREKASEPSAVIRKYPAKVLFAVGRDEDREGFGSRYRLARELQLDHWADVIIDIADEEDRDPRDRQITNRSPKMDNE